MVSASASEDGEARMPGPDRADRRLAALARDLVDTVGVEGAMRYCSSLGWRGVLREVEILRERKLQAE